MLSQVTMALENIPPTKDALNQHIRRATYQAGYSWGQSLIASPVHPSPAQWCWQRAGSR